MLLCYTNDNSIDEEETLEQKLQVVYMNIEDLKPYEKNAKLHPTSQIEEIKNSILAFGMNDPIAICGKDNTIVEGHGRLIACKELDYKEVPVIRLDHLSEEQRKAYTLVHNKLTMNTGFDLTVLEQELDSISMNMLQFGFEDLPEPESLDLEEDGVDLIDNENKQVAVKMVFKNAEKWRQAEETVRAVLDEVDGVGIVVEGYDDES